MRSSCSSERKASSCGLLEGFTTELLLQRWRLGLARPLAGHFEGTPPSSVRPFITYSYPRRATSDGTNFGCRRATTIDFLPFLYFYFFSLSAIFLYLPTHHLQCFLRMTTHTVQRAWRSSRLPHLPHTVPLLYFSLSKRKGDPAVLDLGEAGSYFDTPFFFYFSCLTLGEKGVRGA